MEENTEDEHLTNPINSQSENFKEEIIPVKDTAVINSNPESKNMEIHKHPHHVMHKKKWGEYLLEFFMLFLAVFLGFISENIRESNIEHKREVDYAAELLKELSLDSTACSNKTAAR